MIRINLLPIKQLKRRQQNRAHFFTWIGSFVIVVLVVLALFGVMSKQVTAKINEKNALNRKKAEYDSTIKLINAIKADKEVIETQIQTVRTLKKGSQVAVHLLDEIARVIPNERMWIKTLDVTNNVLSISGVALDNATIANYMNTMDASKFFTDANLAGTNQIDVSGRKLKSFSLKFNINILEENKEENPGT